MKTKLVHSGKSSIAQLWSVKIQVNLSNKIPVILNKTNIDNSWIELWMAHNHDSYVCYVMI